MRIAALGSYTDSEKHRLSELGVRVYLEQIVFKFIFCKKCSATPFSKEYSAEIPTHKMHTHTKETALIEVVFDLELLQFSLLLTLLSAQG